MIWQHKRLFGRDVLESVSTDKGYYSYKNEAYAKACNVDDIYLPRNNERLTKNSYKLTPEKQKELHNRRAGIEPLIGHVENGGQMRRTRSVPQPTLDSSVLMMMVDAAWSTSACGYCLILMKMILKKKKQWPSRRRCRCWL